MLNRKPGIGLAIGDEEAVVAGLERDGSEWLVRIPSVVSAPSEAAGVELLLAGEEVVATGMEALLRAPRQWGYLPGEPAVARMLLTALLATLRQQLDPARLEEAGVPVLALPHTVSHMAANLLTEAARDAGWGQLTLVTELAALAAPDALAQSGRPAEAVVFGGRWVHQATFGSVVEETETTRLTLERLEAALAVSATARAPDPATIARGAAFISAAGPALKLSVAPALPLMIGLMGQGDQFLPLTPAGEPGRVIRALSPPSADGALLQVAAAVWDGEARGCQVMAEAFLASETEADSKGPWLLTLQNTGGLGGEVSVRSASGATVLQQQFRIRLP